MRQGPGLGELSRACGTILLLPAIEQNRGRR